MYYEGAGIVSEARAWATRLRLPVRPLHRKPRKLALKEYNCHFSRSAIKLNQMIATHEGEMRFQDAVAGVCEPVY
jgi:hypothetical protein